MPIYKDEFGATLVDLGHGDITIEFGGLKAGEERQDELIFLDHDLPEGTEIGSPHVRHEGKTTDHWREKCVRIVIRNPDSLLVLIEQAQVLHERMTRGTFALAA